MKKITPPPVLTTFPHSGAFATALRRFAMVNSKPSGEAGAALGIVSPLLNRKPDGQFEFPADNYYLIAPIGNHPHTDTGFVQVVDQKAVEAMANAFPLDTRPNKGLIDFEHESWDQSKRTTAAGWIQNMEARPDGLWAQIRWSKSGKEALAGGDYRFISPVWTFGNCQQIDETHVRPLVLSDAGLTNRPNLQGLPSLSNRELSQSGSDRPHHAADLAENNRKEEMKKVATELGLSADASEETIVAEVQKLKNSASRTTTLETEVTNLKNSNRTLLESTVESDLATAGLEGDEKETWKTQLLANRAGALPLLASLVAARGNATAKTLTNRSGAKTPNDKGKGAGNGAAEKTQSQKIADAVANAQGKSYEERFENAKRANPDLFTPQTEAA